MLYIYIYIHIYVALSHEYQIKHHCIQSVLTYRDICTAPLYKQIATGNRDFHCIFWVGVSVSYLYYMTFSTRYISIDVYINSTVLCFEWYGEVCKTCTHHRKRVMDVYVPVFVPWLRYHVECEWHMAWRRKWAMMGQSEVLAGIRQCCVLTEHIQNKWIRMDSMHACWSYTGIDKQSSATRDKFCHICFR